MGAGEAVPSPCAVSTPALAGPQMCNLSHKGVDPAATGDELVMYWRCAAVGWKRTGNLGVVPASPSQCLEPAAESVLLPDTSRPPHRGPQGLLPRPPARGGLWEASF